MRSLVGVVAFGVVTAALGQPPNEIPTQSDVAQQRFADALSRNRSVVRGSTNPGGIPAGAKLMEFFRLLSRERDATDDVGFRTITTNRFSATDADHQVLNEAARRFEPQLRRLLAEQRSSMVAVCRRMQTGSIEGYAAMSEHLNALEAQSLSALEQYYLDIINRLSATAQQQIQQFIESDVAPHVSYSATDYVGLASEVPTIAEAVFRSRCEQTLEATDDGTLQQAVR